MKEQPQKTIGQMAVESPQTIPVFEKHGLDYYQKGERTLEEACLAAGAEAGLVRRELEAQPAFPLAEEIGERSDLPEIVRYIVVHHHDTMRQELEKMEMILTSMEKGLGNQAHAEILDKLFIALNGSLRRHLLEEENEVFPRLLWAERRGQSVEIPDWKASFLEAVRQVLQEHRMMDKEFSEMRKLAFHFRILNPASTELMEFSKLLERFDQDHRRHIHLENHILLHKMVALGILDKDGKGHHA